MTAHGSLLGVEVPAFLPGTLEQAAMSCRAAPASRLQLHGLCYSLLSLVGSNVDLATLSLSIVTLLVTDAAGAGVDVGGAPGKTAVYEYRLSSGCWWVGLHDAEELAGCITLEVAWTYLRVSPSAVRCAMWALVAGCFMRRSG